MEHGRGSSRAAKNGFREISSSLRERIKGGAFEAGSYLPTERELQVDFGASRTTIRKALAALIESGWAQNVPNRGVVVARGLKPGTSRSVAFINTGTTVSQILLNHLCRLFEEHGLDLVAIGGRGDYPMMQGLIRAAESDHMGAIVWPNVGFPDVEKISEISRGLPILAIDHPIPGFATDLVTFDHEQAAFDATEQLIRQGARRIGVTGMLDMLEITHDRFKGYLRALFAHGLQPDAPDFLFTLTSGMGEPNIRVFEEVIRKSDRPDAFFVLNDICLPAVVGAAIRAGIDVPREMRFATIGDDLDLSLGDIRMTAIGFDWSSLAENAVRLLMQRISNLNQRPQTFVAPHRLKIRGLCGAPPEEWTPESGALSSLGLDDPISRMHFVFPTFGMVEENLYPS